MASDRSVLKEVAGFPESVECHDNDGLCRSDGCDLHEDAAKHAAALREVAGAGTGHCAYCVGSHDDGKGGKGTCPGIAALAAPTDRTFHLTPCPAIRLRGHEDGSVTITDTDRPCRCDEIQAPADAGLVEEAITMLDSLTQDFGRLMTRTQHARMAAVLARLRAGGRG